ncbi:hypothetical protein ACFWZ2_04295 [Streptomyces sp. NPDC059002]|uniref:hypothetical protein n=1 Tax=Streptomyces sp. NPDC059002 TaxID=3346690 RepID=UPI0036B8CA19
MNGVERQQRADGARDRAQEGRPDTVDAPRAPLGAGGWDTRSEELLADAALTPGAGLAPGAARGPDFGAVSVPAFGEGGVAGAGGCAGADGAFSGEARRGGRARAAVAKVGRRGAADPVKALMHRHRELCARAVDPLEIAAGLEAHGVTDRTAARFRHRDVFALAEEMYARVPRGDDTGERPAPSADGDVRKGPEVPAGWALFALLPGAVCALAVAGIALSAGGTRLAVGLGGASAVGLALRIALRYGPLRSAAHPTPSTRAWVCWLLAYALLGDGLLSGAVAGGPDGLWTPSFAALLALSLAVAPAIWCARLFAVRAGRRLGASRGLDEFADSVRPLLLGVFALFLGALGVLLVLSGAVLGEWGGASGGVLSGTLAGAGALGALLLLARLLGAYGSTRAPVWMLGAAGAAEAGALALVFAGRLPGCGALASPVTAAVDTWGPGIVPTTACGLAALALLLHATKTLTRASAHAHFGGAL